MSVPPTAAVQFSIIGQPPSLLNRLASAGPSALPDTYWAPSPSPPPSAPPETPRRPLGRPSLLEALAGEPSSQPAPSSSSTTITTERPAPSAAANSPVASSDSNLFDVFSETLSKTFRSSQLPPRPSLPSASTAPNSFYFHGEMKNTSSNATGPSTSQDHARQTTPSASSSTSAPIHSDAMQVDAPPHAMPSSSLNSSRIPAELKRHYTEHVELLTIRQTHQRVKDLHEELQGRHQDTMHAFEREKEQMQKLITVSAELFEKAGLLIARQEERWRDEEHDLQARERQVQEVQRLAAEAEARAAEQRAREEQERERQRQEEEQRQKEAEEEARRQEEERRRREEIERQRAEIAKKQQEEAQRLADEKAREEAMEKERQAAETAARQAEQERAAKEVRKRQLEEADRLALEAMRREAAAAKVQAAQATVSTPDKSSVRAKGVAQPNIKAPPGSSPTTSSNLLPDGLHLGAPTWTVGPSSSQHLGPPSSGIVVGTPSVTAHALSQTDAVPVSSMTLTYPEETTSLLFQTKAERERKLADTLRKGKGSKSPTSPASVASPSPSVSSKNQAAAQGSNGKQAKVSRPPSNPPAPSPVPSQRTLSRQGATSPTTTASTSQPPTASKPAKARKQKVPAVVLIKPEPTKSPIISSTATKLPPITSSSAPVNAPASQPQVSSRAPPPNGLPPKPKPTIVPPGPRKSTSSKSPDQVKFNGNGDRSVSSSIPAVNSSINGRSAGGVNAQTAGNAVEQNPRKPVPSIERGREPPPHQRVVPRDHDDGWITTERGPVGYTAQRSPTPEYYRPSLTSNTRRAPSPAYPRASRDVPLRGRSPTPPPPRSPVRKRAREGDFDPPPAQRPRYSETNISMHSPVERRAPPPDVGRSQFRGPSPSHDRPYASPTRGRSRSPRSRSGPSRRRSPPPSQTRNTYRPDSPVRYLDDPPYPNVYRPQYSPSPPAPPSLPLSQRIDAARQPAPQSPEPRDDPPELLSRMTDGAPPSSSASRGMSNNSPSGGSPQTSRRGRGRGQQASRGGRGRGGGGPVPLKDRISNKNKNPKMSLESRLG